MSEDPAPRPRISDDAVHAATGRTFSDWFAALDAAGMAEQGHKEIVAHLHGHHRDLDGWWAQSITVAYEQAHGRRVVGQTADAGFQLGVQRSIAAPIEVVWEAVTSNPALWLGEGAEVTFEPGTRYRVPASPTEPAASGEVRVVKPADRVRLTWQPEGWEKPATVQLALTTTASGKTAVRAHLEHLPDAEARDAMRERWRRSLQRLLADQP